MSARKLGEEMKGLCVFLLKSKLLGFATLSLLWEKEMGNTQKEKTQAMYLGYSSFMTQDVTG